MIGGIIKQEVKWAVSFREKGEFDFSHVEFKGKHQSRHTEGSLRMSQLTNSYSPFTTHLPCPLIWKTFL